jgi:hypothetical protein
MARPPAREGLAARGSVPVVASADRAQQDYPRIRFDL